MEVRQRSSEGDDVRMKDGKEREETEKTKKKEATHEKSSKAKRKTTAGPFHS